MDFTFWSDPNSEFHRQVTFPLFYYNKWPKPQSAKRPRGKAPARVVPDTPSAASATPPPPDEAEEGDDEDSENGDDLPNERKYNLIERDNEMVLVTFTKKKKKNTMVSTFVLNSLTEVFMGGVPGFEQAYWVIRCKFFNPNGVGTFVKTVGSTYENVGGYRELYYDVAVQASILHKREQLIQAFTAGYPAPFSFTGDMLAQWIADEIKLRTADNTLRVSNTLPNFGLLYQTDKWAFANGILQSERVGFVGKARHGNGTIYIPDWRTHEQEGYALLVPYFTENDVLPNQYPSPLVITCPFTRYYILWYLFNEAIPTILKENRFPCYLAIGFAVSVLRRDVIFGQDRVDTNDVRPHMQFVSTATDTGKSQIMKFVMHLLGYGLENPFGGANPFAACTHAAKSARTTPCTRTN